MYVYRVSMYVMPIMVMTEDSNGVSVGGFDDDDQ